MKRVLAIAFLIIIVLGVWWLFFKTDKGSVGGNTETKATAVEVKKHSAAFNTGIDNTIGSYLVMKNAFVDGDTGSIKSASFAFITRLDSLNFTDLQNDDPKILTAATQQVSEMKTNATPILQETDLTKMRRNFQNVSENLYPFLRAIGYEGEKLYWQNCPMAFGDEGANWISNTSEIVNPYLGKNHPEFKSAMLHCGENMDSIYVK
ncbi:MAG: DUF3347 domain-containing protein [Ginsengibacter sp.]